MRLSDSSLSSPPLPLSTLSPSSPTQAASPKASASLLANKKILFTHKQEILPRLTYFVGVAIIFFTLYTVLYSFPMDQHPIPQDVTGFQFKLIGSMTVKQFAYVATGVITAVILYYLPLKTNLAILIKVVLIPLFGASGFAIAFIPIDGRPVDIMATNFL